MRCGVWGVGPGMAKINVCKVDENKKTLESLVTTPWNHWSQHLGIIGQNTLESLVKTPWNHWSCDSNPTSSYPENIS